jgi:hypothetical protein
VPTTSHLVKRGSAVQSYPIFGPLSGQSLSGGRSADNFALCFSFAILERFTKYMLMPKTTYCHKELSLFSERPLTLQIAAHAGSVKCP